MKRRKVLTREEWERKKAESRIKLIERLEGLEVYYKKEDLRRIYNNDPKLQQESFEAFEHRVLGIKKIIDNLKIRLGVE